MDVLRLEYDSAISDLEPVNSSFDKGVLRICYTGANRNKTYFSKSVLERSIPTLYNCPIVAHYYREDGSIGGHDVEVITDYDNKLRLVNLTQPVGVIPESAKVYFENVEEENGMIHEYLCAEVLLWKRQEAYKAIKENGVTAESMEITVKDGERIDDVYVVNDFEFTAFALLGDCEPCFEGASLQMSFADFSQEFKSEFSEMMREFKEFNLATASDSEEVDDKNSEKGGCENLEDKNLETFENTEEVVDKAIEEYKDEETAEAVDEVEEQANEEFALNSNLRESIYAAFAGKVVSTEWGEMEQYCIVDYDIEASMVYAWDTVDWLLYGFSYTMDGDVAVVDFDSKKRMKYVIVEFDEGDTQDSPFAFAYDQMAEFVKKSNEHTSEMESKYNDASEKIEAMSTELNDLRLFKSSVEAASDQAKRDELFAQFADLNDVEEFMALVADSSDYEFDALEEKCYAIRGRNMKLNFSNKDTRTPRLPINVGEKDPEEELPYNGVVEKYRHKQNN